MSETRADYAWASLEGLSVGDAFGEQFFGSPKAVAYLVDNRATCAIVGGILAASGDAGSIPPAWTAARESLDTFRGVGLTDT